MVKPIIFCDFDGTITTTDNIISIMEKFAPPEAEIIKNDILSKHISIKTGVEKMFQLLPSNLKEDIVQYLLQEATIRDGFKEFVQYTREQGIPFYVVSGGIDFFVEPLLAHNGPFDGVFCNGSDFSGEQIQLTYPNPCDEQCMNQACGCCKPTIIRTLMQPNNTSIVIGDSITDFEAAKLADFVLARDILLDRCQEKNIPHRPFDTFYDCLQAVKELVEVKI